jgi:hypothetical protein
LNKRLHQSKSLELFSDVIVSLGGEAPWSVNKKFLPHQERFGPTDDMRFRPRIESFHKLLSGTESRE